jgi:hypothetical protein
MREETSQIEGRLRSEKPQHVTSAGFTERVMLSLPRSSEARIDARPRQLLWPRLAIAFSLLGISAALVSEFVSPQKAPVTVVDNGLKNVNPVSVAGSDASPVDGKILLPTITAIQLQALKTNLEDQLETERQHVISDTRVAIQFVASNFLPEK